MVWFWKKVYSYSYKNKISFSFSCLAHLFNCVCQLAIKMVLQSHWNALMGNMPVKQFYGVIKTVEGVIHTSR